MNLGQLFREFNSEQIRLLNRPLQRRGYASLGEDRKQRPARLEKRGAG